MARYIIDNSNLSIATQSIYGTVSVGNLQISNLQSSNGSLTNYVVVDSNGNTYYQTGSINTNGGSSGTSGESGSSGTSGISGSSGTSGESGSSGTSGSNGSSGTSGISGSSGTSGESGSSGTSGSNGSSGTSGVSILTGSGNPNLIPIYGDFVGQVYIDYTNGLIYTFDGSEWGLQLNMNGSSGTSGSNGSSGTSGSNGSSGTSGSNGSSGTSGSNGSSGTSGFGIPEGGTTGQVLVKVDGSNYNTMWSDVVGSGSSGTSGISGSSGTSGISGSSLEIINQQKYPQTTISLGGTFESIIFKGIQSATTSNTNQVEIQNSFIKYNTINFINYKNLNNLIENQWYCVDDAIFGNGHYDKINLYFLSTNTNDHVKQGYAEFWDCDYNFNNNPFNNHIFGIWRDDIAPNIDDCYIWNNIIYKNLTGVNLVGFSPNIDPINWVKLDRNKHNGYIRNIDFVEFTTQEVEPYEFRIVRRVDRYGNDVSDIYYGGLGGLYTIDLFRWSNVDVRNNIIQQDSCWINCNVIINVSGSMKNNSFKNSFLLSYDIEGNRPGYVGVFNSNKFEYCFDDDSFFLSKIFNSGDFKNNKLNHCGILIQNNTSAINNNYFDNSWVELVENSGSFNNNRLINSTFKFQTNSGDFLSIEVQDSIVGSSTWINTEDFKNGVCKKGNRTIYTELDLSDAAIYNQVGKLLTIPLEKASLCGIFMFINNPLLAESAPAEIEKIQNIPQFLYNSIDNTGFLTFIAKFGSASDGSKGVVFLYNSTPGSASPDQIVKPGYILETTIGINSQFNGVFDYVTITSNAGINIINSVNNYF